jgi:long-chain fatty acid transport protein
VANRFSLWIFLAAAHDVVLAGGPVHGAKASAMGTAFVAVADDPSAIVYNPAGLTQLTGTRFYGGGTLVVPSTTYDSPAGDREATAFQAFAPAQLYATSDFGIKNINFGLGLYSPFGIGGRRWDRNGATRYRSIESMIATLWVNPTVAYQILPTVSIGIGLQYMLSQTKTARMIDQSQFGVGDASFRLKATGDGWGYNVGLLFRPLDRISLGFSYRSGVNVDHTGNLRLRGIAPVAQGLFGGAGFDTRVRIESSFPDIVGFGISFRPDSALTLALDVEQVRWSSFRTLGIDLRREVPAAGVSDAMVPLAWRNVWTIKCGTDYRLNEQWALRGGYAYVPSPVPESSLDPGNPDATQHNLSIGVGYIQGPMNVDVFYMAGLFEPRTVDNGILSGSYDSFVHYAGLSVGYLF